MEGIVHVRIDDRLIHGQVAAMWTRRLQATRIMVADDDVAVDDMRKQVLRMAASAGVATSLISVEKAATNIKAGKYRGQRVFLLVNSPLVIGRLRDLGLDITSVNVGNLAKRPGTTQIKQSISVTDEEAASFKRLMDAGVELTCNMVPEDSGYMLKDYLK